MELKSGLKPARIDHRDFDFIKSKRLGGALVAFPDNYSTDAELWMPDQNEGCDLFTPPVPPMPYGCTNYTQCDLLADQDKKLYNPMALEKITRANRKQGTDLRTSFKAVLKLYKKDHPAFFNVQPDNNRGGHLDWFDAARVAMIVGKMENRAVSVGTQWFRSFNQTENGVIAPPNWQSEYSWHNWAVKGWKVINGQTYLIGKPWAGRSYGDGGFCYVSRPLFNALMNAQGSIAYTLDKLLSGETPERIHVSVAQWLTSFFTNLFAKLP